MIREQMKTSLQQTRIVSQKNAGNKLLIESNREKEDLRSNINRMNISLLESIKSYSRLQEIKKMSLNEGVSKERISILLENEKENFRKVTNEILETASDNLDTLEKIGKKLNNNETIKNAINDLRSKLSKINLKGGFQAAFDNFAGVTIKQLTYINSGISSLAENIKAALMVIKTQFKILKIGSSSGDVEKTIEDHINAANIKGVSVEKLKGAIKSKMTSTSSAGMTGTLNKISNFFTGSKPALIDSDKFASELISCTVAQVTDVISGNLDEVEISIKDAKSDVEDTVKSSGLSTKEIADTKVSAVKKIKKADAKAGLMDAIKDFAGDQSEKVVAAIMDNPELKDLFEESRKSSKFQRKRFSSILSEAAPIRNPVYYAKLSSLLFEKIEFAKVLNAVSGTGIEDTALSKKIATAAVKHLKSKELDIEDPPAEDEAAEPKATDSESEAKKKEDEVTEPKATKEKTNIAQREKNKKQFSKIKSAAAKRKTKKEEKAAKEKEESEWMERFKSQIATGKAVEVKAEEEEKAAKEKDEKTSAGSTPTSPTAVVADAVNQATSEPLGKTFKSFFDSISAGADNEGKKAAKELQKRAIDAFKGNTDNLVKQIKTDLGSIKGEEADKIFGSETKAAKALTALDKIFQDNLKMETLRRKDRLVLERKNRGKPLESKNYEFIASSTLKRILKESKLMDTYYSPMNNRQNIESLTNGEKMKLTESHLRRIIREEISRTSRRKPLKEMSRGGPEFDQLHDEFITKIQRMIIDYHVAFVEVAKNASGFGGYERFTAIDDDSWIGALEDAVGKGNSLYIASVHRGILSIGLANDSSSAFANKMARGHYGRLD